MPRTGRGPLGPMWALLYAGTTRAAALALRLLAPVAAVYVRGSFALRAPVHGLSAVDLVAVVDGHPEQPGENGRRLRRRLSRVYRLLPRRLPACRG